MKRCPKCGKLKPASMFYRRERSKDGRTTHCAVCINKQVGVRVQKLKAQQERDGWGPLPEEPLARWREQQRRQKVIKAENDARQAALRYVQEHEEPDDPLEDLEGPQLLPERENPRTRGA